MIGINFSGRFMKKILIIEDDSSIAELERDYMEINSYSVDIEVSGDTGLRTALNGDYKSGGLDLVLMITLSNRLARDISGQSKGPLGLRKITSK